MRRSWGMVGIAVLAVLGGILIGSLAGELVAPAGAQSGAQRQGAGPAGVKPQARPPAPKSSVAAPPEQTQSAVARTEEQAAREARERDERAALDRQLAESAAALGNHALGLTYAAIGLMVVAASLWLMTFLQSRDIKAAVRAVQESSSAARTSAELAQRALVLTQRATVIVGEPRAVWLRDADERLVGCRLLVTWHNVGGTPTKDMTAAVAGLASEKPPAQTGALPNANARLQPAIVGPNAAINSAYVNLPIGLVADILEHRAYYLFAGWAEYNDVFEGTPRHRVEFCYWLEFEGDVEAQNLEAHFHIHGKHNRHCDSGEDSAAPADGSGASGGSSARKAGAGDSADMPAAQHA